MTCALLLAAALAAAAPADIDIRSETLVVEHDARKATFGGGVTALRGDLTLRCPEVVALYDGAARVTTVRCAGPVSATQGERTMTAGEGTFDNVKGELTLTGEPTLVEGARRIVGEQLVYDVATRRAQLVKGQARLPARDAPGSGRLSGQGPLAISAEQVAWDSDARSATFTGGVTAVRGDLTLHARSLVTTHDEEGNVERAFTSGGPVRVVQGERRAQAGKATFLGRAGRLVLEQEPTVTERGSTLAGDRVTFLLGQDRVEVERPRASFPLEALPAAAGGPR